MSWREWLLAALFVLALLVLVFFLVLPWAIRRVLWVLLALRYRLRVRGLENLPRTGSALLIANHVTWIDGFVLAAACPRRGRALVNAGIINLPVFKTWARRAGLIPVPFSGPRALRASITATREALDQGEVVAIFPEAQLTRTGLMGPFYRGLEVILDGREQVPTIPVYLDNLWGSIFSFSGGRFLRKRPQGWRRRVVNIVFGPPIALPVTAFSARQALLATGVRAFALRNAPVAALETIDPSLPHLDHPVLGHLTGSTAHYESGAIRQTGNKPGTVGHPLPGVALRVVDEQGEDLGTDVTGRLEALVAGQAGWTDTGLGAQIDRDGFVRLAETPQPAGS